MEWLVWLLVWAAKVLLILITLLLLALAVFIQLARHQVVKFQTGLPWLRWLTLDQIVEMGFSRFWARVLLPLFHEKGNLEARIGGGEIPDDIDQEIIEVLGFSATTVQFYEFRLTKRGNRKKPKFKDLLKSLRAIPVPVRA